MKRKFSNRNFGISWALGFFGLALVLLFKKGYEYQSEGYLFLISIVLLFLSVFAPKKLAFAADAWHSIGQRVGKVTNPIILGILFFGIVTPVAIVGKLFGRDVLKMKHENVSSYWALREDTGLSKKSFERQF